MDALRVHRDPRVSVVDEVGQAQLNHFAKLLKQAMAADVTIVIAEKANHELKLMEVGVGICAPVAGLTPQEQKAGMKHIFGLLIDLADSMVEQDSEGKIRVVFRRADGTHSEPQEALDADLTVIVEPGNG